jgi:hypothetical protein
MRRINRPQSDVCDTDCETSHVQERDAFQCDVNEVFQGTLLTNIAYMSKNMHEPAKPLRAFLDELERHPLVLVVWTVCLCGTFLLWLLLKR